MVQCVRHRGQAWGKDPQDPQESWVGIVARPLTQWTRAWEVGAVHPWGKLASQTPQNSELWHQWDALFQYGRSRVIEKTLSTVSVSYRAHTCTHARETIHIHTPHDMYVRTKHQQRKHKVIVISLCFLLYPFESFSSFFVCVNVCISMSKKFRELLKNCPYQVTHPMLLFHHYAKQLGSSTYTEEQLTWIKVFRTSGSWQFDSVASGPGAG